MLASGDFAAVELARQQRDALLAAFGTEGESILRDIVNFDYRSALARMAATSS